MSERVVESRVMGPFVPRVAIAALDYAGRELWTTRFPPLDRTPIAALRTGAVPADETPWARVQREALEALQTGQHVQAVSVPLTVLDDGGRGAGGVFLIGCGRLGALMPSSPREDDRRPQCHPSQSARLALIDSHGNLFRQAIVGEPLRGEPDNRLALPRHISIDAPLRACVVDDSEMPTVLWFGPGAAAIRDLLARMGFWDAAAGYMAYGGSDPTWLHIPAWDAVTVDDRDYLLLGHFIPGRDRPPERMRMRLVLVRMDGDRPSMLLERTIAPMARLRLALGERAIYGLSGDLPNRLPRIPITPARDDLPPPVRPRR